MFNHRSKHTHRSPLEDRRRTRYKVYWSRSTSSSSSSGTIRVKPKVAGLHLYIVLGNGGDNANFRGGGVAIPAPTHPGYASGVGTSNDYESNLIIAEPGAATAAGYAYNSCVVGAPPSPCYAGSAGEPVDLTKWSATTWIRNVQGNAGAWYATYDSWYTPGSARTVSSYTGTVDGPGASGYNDYAQNSASYPALGGYVKVTIV